MPQPPARGTRRVPLALVLGLCLLLFTVTVSASIGDHLPEFRNCVNICKQENCNTKGKSTPIPLHRRLLLWDCPSECDYTCQHIITDHRERTGARIVQFHGKWPFTRLLGMQEPLSVLFSLGNLWAHHSGLSQIRTHIPTSYPLRPYYVRLAYVGIAAWAFSAIFHTRDFVFTEQLDYFAAGANVLYGLYYAPIRIFRLDRRTPKRESLRRAWTALCVLMYAGHVAYMKGVRWNYTYNMTANVAVGGVQNLLWSWFSLRSFRRSGKWWQMWPGFVVAWVMLAMSLELFDFAPFLRIMDAHSLWHLGTIVPTMMMYNFLVKDAQNDIAGGSGRLKS